MLQSLAEIIIQCFFPELLAILRLSAQSRFLRLPLPSILTVQQHSQLCVLLSLIFQGAL